VSTSKDKATERARQFIDDVLKINAEHGMRSVTSEGAYEAAVAAAARTAREYEQISSHISPAKQQSH
jgi:hypothetical protein